MKTQTKFASPERVSEAKIFSLFKAVESEEYVRKIFESLSTIAIIINEERQIVFASRKYLQLFGETSIEEFLGKRPGESISCLHADEEENGCGTSESCTVCGLVQAVLVSQGNKKKVSREARIKTKDASWELMVTVSPISISNYSLYIVTLEDISYQKRKVALEKMFFHDIYNSVGGINGLMNLINKMPNKNDGLELIDLSVNLSHELLDEIATYRNFTLAEKGELELQISKINTRELIKDTIGRIKYHRVAQNKNMQVDTESADLDFHSDKILLSRILINMLKNALEATIVEDDVRIGCTQLKDNVCFYVNNKAVMDKNVQLQVFNRSFSTKGKNRGIGTYSIKLFGENYLKGKVYFSSNLTEGTTFYIELPING